MLKTIIYENTYVLTYQCMYISLRAIRKIKHLIKHLKWRLDLKNERYSYRLNKIYNKFSFC